MSKKILSFITSISTNQNTELDITNVTFQRGKLLNKNYLPIF
jgi:hypothetical protein